MTVPGLPAQRGKYDDCAGCRQPYDAYGGGRSRNAARVKKTGKPLRLWGENAGDIGCADHPETLADTILENGFFGLDYTHSHFIFEEDGITPNRLFPTLGQAYRRIRQAASENLR